MASLGRAEVRPSGLNPSQKIGGGTDTYTGESQQDPQPPKLVRLSEDRYGAHDYRDLEEKRGLIATIVDL